MCYCVINLGVLAGQERCHRPWPGKLYASEKSSNFWIVVFNFGHWKNRWFMVAKGFLFLGWVECNSQIWAQESMFAHWFYGHRICHYSSSSSKSLQKSISGRSILTIPGPRNSAHIIIHVIFDSDDAPSTLTVSLRDWNTQRECGKNWLFSKRCHEYAQLQLSSLLILIRVTWGAFTKKNVRITVEPYISSSRITKWPIIFDSIWAPKLCDLLADSSNGLLRLKGVKWIKIARPNKMNSANWAKVCVIIF